jgi:hypothetical protein
MTRRMAPQPHRLWRAADAIRGKGLGADADWLVAEIDHYRANAHAGHRLEVGLGLDTPPDRRPWHAAWHIERRDAFIAVLVGDRRGPVRPIAKSILAEARRYETRVLTRHLSGEARPRDAREGALLELHRMAEGGGPKWPLGDSQLRRWLRMWLGHRLQEIGGEMAQASGAPFHSKEEVCT